MVASDHGAFRLLPGQGFTRLVPVSDLMRLVDDNGGDGGALEDLRQQRFPFPECRLGFAPFSEILERFDRPDDVPLGIANRRRRKNSQQPPLPKSGKKSSASQAPGISVEG